MVAPVVGAAIASGALSVLGGAMRNKQARKAAAKQMAFQERMSSTAHQREVKDLRAAGLNPILSATGGPGASSPGGAQAPVQDILTPGVSSALAARRMAQEIKNLQAVELKTEADTRLTEQQSSVIRGPAGVGDWLGTLIDDFNTNLGEARRVAPVAGQLLRGGVKIRADQLEDFLRSSARGARELRGRIARWISENLKRNLTRPSDRRGAVSLTMGQGVPRSGSSDERR